MSQPASLPDGVYHAGYRALHRRYGHTPDTMEQAMIVADAVAPEILGAERARVLDLLRAADAWITELENRLTRLGQEVGDGPDLEGFLREADR